VLPLADRHLGSHPATSETALKRPLAHGDAPSWINFASPLVTIKTPHRRFSHTFELHIQGLLKHFAHITLHQPAEGCSLHGRRAGTSCSCFAWIRIV
jgi:hypothetical protein